RLNPLTESILAGSELLFDFFRFLEEHRVRHGGRLGWLCGHVLGHYRAGHGLGHNVARRVELLLRHLGAHGRYLFALGPGLGGRLEFRNWDVWDAFSPEINPRLRRLFELEWLHSKFSNLSLSGWSWHWLRCLSR